MAGTAIASGVGITLIQHVHSSTLISRLRSGLNWCQLSLALAVSEQPAPSECGAANYTTGHAISEWMPPEAGRLLEGHVLGLGD